MKDYEGTVKSKTLTSNNDKLCDRKVDNLAGTGSFFFGGGGGWAASVCRGGGAGDLLHGQCDESPVLPPGGSVPLRAATPGDPGLAGVDITLNFLSINVCGIKSKLKFPDFCNFIQNYDNYWG